MSYIGATQGTSSPVLLDSITVVNGQASYTMQKDGVNFTPASTLVMQVSLNGLIQQPTSSYSIDGSTITFASNLVTGDVIDYILVREATTGTVSVTDGSVTNSKIVSMAASKLTGALPALDGSALTGVSAGKVLQVKSTTKTDTASFTSAYTNTFVDLSGLSVSITPSSTSSKIQVLFTVNVSQSAAATVHVRLVRDSTAIYVGDQVGSSRIRSSSIWRNASTPYLLEVHNLNGNHLDEPATTSSVTYKLQGPLGATYSGTFYVNRPGSDGDYDFAPRTASSITVMEIEA